MNIYNCTTSWYRSLRNVSKFLTGDKELSKEIELIRSIKDKGNKKQCKELHEEWLNDLNKNQELLLNHYKATLVNNDLVVTLFDTILSMCNGETATKKTNVNFIRNNVTLYLRVRLEDIIKRAPKDASETVISNGESDSEHEQPSLDVVPDTTSPLPQQIEASPPKQADGDAPFVATPPISPEEIVHSQSPEQTASEQIIAPGALDEFKQVLFLMMNAMEQTLDPSRISYKKCDLLIPVTKTLFSVKDIDPQLISKYNNSLIQPTTDKNAFINNLHLLIDRYVRDGVSEAPGTWPALESFLAKNNVDQMLALIRVYKENLYSDEVAAYIFAYVNCPFFDLVWQSMEKNLIDCVPKKPDFNNNTQIMTEQEKKQEEERITAHKVAMANLEKYRRARYATYAFCMSVLMPRKEAIDPSNKQLSTSSSIEQQSITQTLSSTGKVPANKQQQSQRQPLTNSIKQPWSSRGKVPANKQQQSPRQPVVAAQSTPIGQ